MATSLPLSRTCLRFTSGRVPRQLSAATATQRPFHHLGVAPRRHQPQQHQLPLLDFLIPSLAATPASNYGHAISSHATRRVVRRRYTTTSAPRQLQAVVSSSSSSTSDMASSSMETKTSAILNPRKDEDGNDMTVEITPRASNRLREIMSKDSNPNLALRIQVESGGCHGFQYLMSLTTLSPDAASQKAPASELDDEEDTVFAAGDGSGARVVMDWPSLELLKGSKVDYTMELIGSQFKIVDNPLATSSCGCGTSFDIKA